MVEFIVRGGMVEVYCGGRNGGGLLCGKEWWRLGEGSF